MSSINLCRRAAETFWSNAIYTWLSCSSAPQLRIQFCELITLTFSMRFVRRMFEQSKLNAGLACRDDAVSQSLTDKRPFTLFMRRGACIEYTQAQHYEYCGHKHVRHTHSAHILYGICTHTHTPFSMQIEKTSIKSSNKVMRPCLLPAYQMHD